MKYDHTTNQPPRAQNYNLVLHSTPPPMWKYTLLTYNKEEEESVPQHNNLYCTNIYIDTMHRWTLKIIAIKTASRIPHDTVFE